MRTDKKNSIFGRELYFYNNELYKAAKLAIDMGYKVHTFNPSGFYISQIFVDNGITFGSISECYSGVKHSTCHKSEHGSGNGTGFGLSSDPMLVSKDLINECFIFAPLWAKSTDRIKKESWQEYISRPINQILKYAEIKL